MWYQLFCGCGATSISDGIIVIAQQSLRIASTVSMQLKAAQLTHAAQGSLSAPKWMNFWKISKGGEEGSPNFKESYIQSNSCWFLETVTSFLNACETLYACMFSHNKSQIYPCVTLLKKKIDFCFTIEKSYFQIKYMNS